MTVGQLRRLLRGIANDVPVFIDTRSLLMHGSNQECPRVQQGMEQYCSGHEEHKLRNMVIPKVGVDSRGRIRILTMPDQTTEGVRWLDGIEPLSWHNVE